MFYTLDASDFIIIGLLAAVLTWCVNKIAELIKSLKTGSVELGYSNQDMEIILEKCYDLFPKEMLQFRGEIIKRGMRIRIITNQNKVFEGKFLGFNSDDMICLMTKKFIIAHALTNIDEIETL